MANIKTFEAPSNLGLTPSETGVESVAAAARRAGAFYNQAGEALASTGQRFASDIRDVGQVVTDHIDHQQITAGADAGAKLFDSLSQSKDSAIRGIDPSDPQYGQKVETAVQQWREQQLEPALDKFREGFSTERSQDWAEQFIEKTRNHMFTSSAADIVSAAGIGIKNNITNTISTASNTAIRDPSSVPAQLDLVEHAVTGAVGSSNVKGIQGAQLQSDLLESSRKKIIQSGAIGAIAKSSDPEATAEQWIQKYPQYIDGAEAKALANNARQQIRARNYDDETNRRRAKQDAQDKSTEATNQYIIDVRSKDPKLANDPTAQKILNDYTLTKTDKNNLLNYIDRQLKPETDARTSQQTFVGLLREMRDPNADPDKVMQKAWDARLADPGKPGSLTEHDFNQFRQEVVARKTPEGAALERDRSSFFKNYGTAIAGSSYTPATGDPKIYNAEMDARRMEGMLRQKGLDPHLAYDPSSEYFLGKPERIGKWAQSMQVDLQDRAQQPPPANKPAVPQVPPALRGIAALSHNKDWTMFRDDTTGKVYNTQGDEVRK